MRIFSRIFTRQKLENAKSPHFYTVCKSHSDRIFRSQTESHFDRIFTRVPMARHRMPAFLHDIGGARGLFLDFDRCFHVQITTRIFTAFLQCETHSDFDRIFTALCACRSTLAAFLQWLARRDLTAFSRGKMKKSKKGFRPHFYHAKAGRTKPLVAPLWRNMPIFALKKHFARKNTRKNDRNFIRKNTGSWTRPGSA